jgi:hypothetical protein
VTFTYNLHKSTLEALLSASTSASTASAIEAALNVANLGTGTIQTTYVDKDPPHTFPSNLPGFTAFQSSGQLFIADAPTPINPDGTLGDTPQINVTDYAGGNYFATGVNPDILNITNLSSNVDLVWGSGSGETIILDGTFVASGTGGNASGHSTIIGGQDSLNYHQNTLWGGAGSDELWGGGRSVVHAGNGEQTINAGQWATAADTVYTAAGHDTVNTWNGNDLIYGYNTDGQGNLYTDGYNTIYTGSGSDTIYAGQHTEIYGVSVGDTAHSGTGVTEIFGATVSGATTSIVAGENNMYIGLDAGNASIEGGTGKLFIWNGSGSDTIKLGAGDDIVNLANTGSSSIYGASGNDTVNYVSDKSNATVLGGGTVNIVDQTTAITGTDNKDGTTTYTFGSGSSAHTLTVDGNVQITWGKAADTSSFDTWKQNV